MPRSLPSRGDAPQQTPCAPLRALASFLVLVIAAWAPLHAQTPPEKPAEAQAARPGVAIARPSGKTIYPRISLAEGYEPDASWPHPSHKETGWGAMAGVAIDPAGRIWTFNRGPRPVQVFEPDGSPSQVWGEPRTGAGEPVEFREPHQIRFDRSGHAWLVDSGLHAIRKFKLDGTLLQTLGTPGEPGADAAHFDKPTDIAIAPEGDLFVSDGYGNNRVVHFNAQGKFVKTWGSLGAAPGEFSLPHSIAIDSRGRLYVADRNNARIQVFDRSGKFLAQWRNLMTPWHLVITEADEVYACGSSPMRWSSRWIKSLALPGIVLGVPPKDQLVMVFSPEGHVQRLWTFPMGKRPGEVEWVHGMAVDSRGNLYLGDIMGRRAQRFLHLDADPATGGINDLAKDRKKPKQDAPVQRAGGEAAKGREE